MENIKCILCNVDEAEFFLEDSGYQAVKCKHCGLVYVNPRPDSTTLKATYEDDYRTSAALHWTSIEEKLLKAQLDLALIKRYKTKGKVLDIGCAEGTFLAEANKLEYEPYGIEINKRFVEYAKNKYRLVNVFLCDILESSFPEGYFDIICMRNVLCHLHNPIKELNKINKFLKEDGIFVCVTGNAGDLSTKQIKRYSNFFSLHIPQHLFHYSEHNLYSLFAKTGFRIKKIYKLYAYLDEYNELFYRIINCILNKALSIKALAFIRISLGRLWFKNGRWLSLIIFASKNKLYSYQCRN